MKYKVRSLAIKMRIAKNKWAIIQEFGARCDKTDKTEEEAQNLIKLQGYLNKLYEEKAKGAFIHSKRKWLQHAEKKT